MRRIGLVLDPVFEKHVTGPGHPEKPERLRGMRDAFRAAGLTNRCISIAPEPAADDLILLVHDADHVRRVDAACATGARILDSMDTAICPDSAQVARLAAGSLIRLAREVAEGRMHAGFAAVRPPGHHAERDLAMGFCLFNNIAIAAAWLRRYAGIARVLVVDWDVHHGNGTQHIFEEDASVFYFSCHQMPLYPGTGAASERGRAAGVGATLNCPLAPGTGDETFLGTLSGPLVDAMETFRPEFVLISAGFDAHRADPLGGLAVSTPAFAEATRIVRGIADRHASGRIVSALEGGYDLDALAAAAATHVEQMLTA